MALEWKFAERTISLRGFGPNAGTIINPQDGQRQQETAVSILNDLRKKPGIILADEVGMGKTYVALAVISSVLLSTRDTSHPIVVMVPPGLISKWRNDWEDFKQLCLQNDSDGSALRRMRAESAETPTEFFRFLDDKPGKRARLIWVTTSCFHAGLNDGWIKLAFIRLARSNSKLNEETKKRIYKWATDMSRLKAQRSLRPEAIEKLMHLKISQWHRYLVREEILAKNSDNPIPEHLMQHQKQLDCSDLAKFLREATPGRQGEISNEKLNEKRREFSLICATIYSKWMRLVKWRASLLVLDEAHHAKNDGTRLAKLFRSEGSDELLSITGDLAGGQRPQLWDKFDRMLFLTATPFQLGHHELMRVIRSFAAAKWAGPNAPDQTRQDFIGKLKLLEQSLSNNRLAGKRLDDLWGRIDRTKLAVYQRDGVSLSDASEQWWDSAENGTDDALVVEIKKAVERCRETKMKAEDSPDDPWAGLRAWVVRHNRPQLLPAEKGKPSVVRRQHRPGGEISIGGSSAMKGQGGIPLGPNEAAPFFVAARAQGELAQITGKGHRAFFAEGLCSSYEAFHHTREQRGDVRDVDDNNIEHNKPRKQEKNVEAIVPIQWYEDHVSQLIPSKNETEERRFEHPKIRSVVGRAVDLWLSGEKVLVFCFYRQTAIALRDHIQREVELAYIRRAAKRLDLDPASSGDIKRRLRLIARRLTGKDSPFQSVIHEFLEKQIGRPEFAAISANEHLRQQLIKMLTAYVRSESFIARYLPLETPEIRRAFIDGKSVASVVRKGAEALRQTLERSDDRSGMSLKHRIGEFLKFVQDLAGKVKNKEDTEGDVSTVSQLDAYLSAVSGGLSDDDGDDQKTSGVRATPVVRMVFGDTKQEIRQRVMYAFNSPLFPEILISSAVLGEGVDLHRFCRYVIHHDLCWNPSTLEQRTGRLDRIRCKAELVHHPIEIYEPFIAGSADEKMYRVVKDRERWFQIVMGQKFEFDEKTSEDLARRIPLPETLARSLIFDLRRYRTKDDLVKHI